MIEVEVPLIEAQLKMLDSQLEKAISQFNWNSSGESMVDVMVSERRN